MRTTWRRGVAWLRPWGGGLFLGTRLHHRLAQVALLLLLGLLLWHFAGRYLRRSALERALSAASGQRAHEVSLAANDLGASDGWCVGLLVAALEDRDESVQRHALAGLRKIGPAAKDAAPAL